MKKEGKVYSYGPYVREMNLWCKHVDEVLVVAPFSSEAPSKIDLPYLQTNVTLQHIPAISLTSPSEVLKTIIKIPLVKWRIFNAMRKADHIHLRCPGNIGLLGCFIQIVFPKKTKTAKYAGNWDPKAEQPWSYKLQKWLLSNTFLTKNMQVLVYGEWPMQTKNIKSFFTATYKASQIKESVLRTFQTPYRFVFVGSLSPGKRPLYAVQLVETIKNKGFDVFLDIYGDGVERAALEAYITENELSERISLHGNQTSETVEKAYTNSDFMILPSKSEGWPKVVAEAMFWGVIPIVTKISCVPWMLEEGERGVLIDVDLETDTAKLVSLIKNPQNLGSMSSKAKTWSQNYTLDSFEAEIEKLIHP